MQETSTISFDLASTDAAVALAVQVWFDGTCIFQTDHLHQQKIAHVIDDTDGEHELKIVLSGKQIDHTKIDSQGMILQDVMISVDNFDIDGIDVNQLLQSKIVYTHDFNGTQPEIQDSFYGHMGCNGVLSFVFTTPLYMWLLENM